MKLIVCLDDKNGMMFNNRRQSADRTVYARILEMTKDACLWMNAYSAKQFKDFLNVVSVDEQFLEKVDTGDYAFLENADVTPYIEKIECIIVYRWNTVYPSDKQFPVNLLVGKEPIAVNTFAGHSHPCITEEIYEC